MAAIGKANTPIPTAAGTPNNKATRTRPIHRRRKTPQGYFRQLVLIGWVVQLPQVQLLASQLATPWFDQQKYNHVTDPSTKNEAKIKLIMIPT